MLPLALLAVAQLPGKTMDHPIDVGGMLCHPTRLLVKLRNVEDTAGLHDVQIRQAFPQIRYVVVEVPAGQLTVFRDSLRTRHGVERVDYDRAARAAYEPNDPMWPDMWHARTIKAHLAWDLTFGSANVVVGVMDTGVNVAHPDLQANVWINTAEIPGNGIDDDGNGRIDDVNGFDFYYNDGNPNDVHGHGTACAGLVAAIQDNNIGVTGVAPRAKIMALKSSTDDGYFYDSANIGAYLYAEQMGADIISCSFFSDRVSQAEMDAVDYIWSRGVLPVVAAGNASTIYPYYPGAYESVLAVAATDQNDNKAGFSNHGSWVDVAAPGVSLRTTTVSDYTSGFGGTSGATPQVAGLAALLKGANPNLTHQELRTIIEDTATSLSWDFSNYGLINSQQAARVALGLDELLPRTPIVRYMTPYVATGRAGMMGGGEFPARIYGRGFEAPREVRVRVGTKNARILAQTRNYVDFMLPTGSDAVSVYVNNVLIRSMSRYTTIHGTAYPLIEASARAGGNVTGGFGEAARADGVSLECTQQSDGLIRLDGTFRRVQTFGAGMKLQIRRHYSGTTGGTEKIYLYNWSSASLPYGTFTKISELPVLTAPGTNLIDVPQPWRYVDEDGTMYLRIDTSGTTSGAKLHLDQVMILQR